MKKVALLILDGWGIGDGWGGGAGRSCSSNGEHRQRPEEQDQGKQRALHRGFP